MVASTSLSTIPLSKTTKFIVDNRGRTAPTSESGIPLIATNCISNDRLYPAYERLRFVSKDTYDNWFRSHPEPGDIILTNKGSQNGAICLVPNPVDFVIAQDMVALRANAEVIDPLFLFAALRSPDVQRQIRDLDVSGVIPHLKKTDFDKLHLPYPERFIQERIGRVYFDFSDKIELNRRMNATLEAMARALFQSWFVDFDPVQRNIDGESPRPEDSLFPDSFENSELGEMPTGWHSAPIAAVCDINGWTLSKKDDLPNLEYVEISEVNRGDIANISNYLRGDEPSRARRRLRHGDTVLSTVRPDRGSYFLALDPPSNRVASTGFAVLTPTKAPWSYVHAAMIQPNVFEHLGHVADGGAYPAVRPEIVGAWKVAVPNNSKILDAFHRTCAPLFEKAEANRIQSRTLAILRDTLLPQLLSGEINTISQQ